jgi:hypothetical protein
LNEPIEQVMLDVPDEKDKSKQELALHAYGDIQLHCGQNLLHSGAASSSSSSPTSLTRHAKIGNVIVEPKAGAMAMAGGASADSQPLKPRSQTQ